jgi:galactokinase
MSGPTADRRPAPTRDRVVAFGPGRVNLIGEHTDYNGGLGLPFAIAEGVTVTATPRDDDRIVAHATDLQEDDEFALAAIEPAAGWRAFVRGIAAELAADGLPVTGATLDITGTVPRGSGLSSSAGLETALAFALLGLHDAQDVDPIALARLCSRVENTWVGAQTGLLDQLAALCGTADGALLIDFAAVTVEPVPLDLGEWTLATVDSHVVHDLSDGGGYNERRAECQRACERMGIEFLAQADRAAVGQLPGRLRRRALHVLDEDQRVRDTVTALHDGDLEAVGRLLDASHASLRDLYDASADGVEHTVDALHAAGAVGARMVGGGFGGHVLGLFPAGVDLPSDALVVTPSAGARLLEG